MHLLFINGLLCRLHLLQSVVVELCITFALFARDKTNGFKQQKCLQPHRDWKIVYEMEIKAIH